jgi:hypothetical protein
VEICDAITDSKLNGSKTKCSHYADLIPQQGGEDFLVVQHILSGD